MTEDCIEQVLGPVWDFCTTNFDNNDSDTISDEETFMYFVLMSEPLWYQEDPSRWDESGVDGIPVTDEDWDAKWAKWSTDGELTWDAFTTGLLDND